ncbi:MAG TPA: universal stress protein [Nocardioides sp.]|nr:universal stress protein [Nocardioides sp.]
MAARSNMPIVLGVDTGTLEGRTLRWAAEQAHLEGRRLQLVTAARPAFPGQRDHGMGSLLVGSRRLNLRGEAVLDWAREELHLTAPYVEVDQMFQVADPSTLLIQLTSSAHLVVLGSRGRGSLRSHVLGSVALAVIRHAVCPVVVHRPVYPGLAHRGIVVAAEATEDSTPVLAFAFRQASLRRLPLRVAHFVYDARSELVGAPTVGDLAEASEQHERLLAESLAGLREDFPDVQVSVETERGLPAQGLASLSKQADVTVVGRHQRGIIARLLAGSVSGSVVQHGHGPIAIVPVS